MTWPAGLIHYWKLNESGTDSIAKDSVGNWDLTRTGGSWVTGKYGNGYQRVTTGKLEKTNLVFTIPDQTTFEFWFKIPTEPATFSDLFSIYRVGDFSGSIHTYVDQYGFPTPYWALYFDYSDNPHGILASDVADLIPLNMNTWYHCAIVFNLTTHTLKIYINGIYAMSYTYTNNYNVHPLVFANTQIHLSDSASDSIIDDVRIWDVERTQAQIIESMNSELPLKSARSRLIQFARC